jgi:Sensors of blue-light using FAD
LSIWAESGAVYFLVYVSAAVTWFSDSELRALLSGARARNEHAGITGMLLYKDGNFMQAIEGPEAAVRALYRRIEADRRHHGLLVLDSGAQEARQFALWSMAFHDLSAGRGEMPAGYSRFMDEPLNAPAFAQQPGRCHELLAMFRAID